MQVRGLWDAVRPPHLLSRKKQGYNYNKASTT